MDIVTHTLTGMTLGSCLAIHTNSWKKRLACILSGGLGGMLPDLDAISLWSGFDGKAIYYGKLWYSHHGFMHSLAAILLFTLLLYLFFLLLHRKQINRFSYSFRRYSLILLSFAGGYFFHLLQDMITPASSWGGVRLFFPFTSYIGGTGSIWWWNNYDLFLIVMTVFVSNLILLLLRPLWKRKTKLAVWVLFISGSLLFIWQIHTRDFNFNKHPYDVSEEKSLDIQKKILPTPVYRQMTLLDLRLPVYF